MTLRSLAVAAGTVAALYLAPLAAVAPAHAGDFVDCGEVGYTSPGPVSGSHYGAQRVQAKGTACKVALKVAKASAERGGSTYASSGFTCKPGKLRADKRRPYNCSKKKNGRIVARVRFITVGNDG